jgi:hypothetical protein
MTQSEYRTDWRRNARSYRMEKTKYHPQIRGWSRRVGVRRFAFLTLTAVAAAPNKHLNSLLTYIQGVPAVRGRVCHGSSFPGSGTGAVSPVPIQSKPERQPCGTGPPLLGAGTDFRSRHRLRDRIYNGIYLNFGIKYYRMHEKFGAGSDEAGAGAVKDRS